MLIVGELINASRKAIKAALDSKDVKVIHKVAQDQFDAGANYIDVNAGVLVGQEPENLK
jgi:5-methyltetrahydrofolate--homocysteine methyltransferase